MCWGVLLILLRSHFLLTMASLLAIYGRLLDVGLRGVPGDNLLRLLVHRLYRAGMDLRL